MTPHQFFYKVEAMRQAQRDYFQNRLTPDSRKYLRKSKALEAEIDCEIKRVRQIMNEEARLHEMGL